MTVEDIVVIFGIILMTILFGFSIKMGFEHLIKNYDKEINLHFKETGHSAINIRKPLKKEKSRNPFLKTVSFNPFLISPLILNKYRIVETKNKNGTNKKNWVEIKIRYLRKPKLEYK